jgi:protein TonB
VAAAATAPAAPAAPTAPKVLPFGPDMSRPVLISGTDPVWTREALIANVEGVMIAKCTITTAGTLQNCRIVKGLPFMDKSMLDALASRRYTPVMLQGKPVSVEYVFSMRLVRK